MALPPAGFAVSAPLDMVPVPTDGGVPTLSVALSPWAPDGAGSGTLTQHTVTLAAPHAVQIGAPGASQRRAMMAQSCLLQWVGEQSIPSTAGNVVQCLPLEKSTEPATRKHGRQPPALQECANWSNEGKAFCW